MDELVKFFEKLSEEVKILNGDVKRIADSHKSGGSPSDEERKSPPMKSMRPMTRLYGSKEEILNAKENPDVDFVSGKIKDIFGK